MAPAAVHTTRVVYRFGPFILDPARRRLWQHDERVPLADRPMDVLLCLVGRAGRTVDKETLIAAAWPDTAVSDDSLRQAVNALRHALGRQSNDTYYIETRLKRGYQFSAPLASVDELPDDESISAMLDPFRSFIEGRAFLESLDRDRIARALDVFGTALQASSASPQAQMGMANACFLTFEATRIDSVPDRASLDRAEQHARAGCRLLPAWADAWGTFAMVRHRQGHDLEAVAAAKKAVSLAPSDWCHHLQLAAVSWGQERVRAAHHALELNADLALAHWLAATVYVARGLFDKALHELLAGCALQDAHPLAAAKMPAVGLHWLRGLVLAAIGAEHDAREALERELARADVRHVYGREASANSRYALNALDLHAALRNGTLQTPDAVIRTVASRPATNIVDAAMINAAALSLQHQHDEAARICRDAIGSAPPGSAGWLLPVEPLLHVHAHPDAWAPALLALRQRAM